MDAFIKAVRSPIHRPFSLSSSKHKKLPDKWGDYQHQDKIWDGVTFHVKYLGNTLVTELDEEGQSYGDSISADAVKTIVAMAKASGKKLPKMSILVSPNGICVTNTETQQVLTDLDVYRICFCTADRDHPKVFAYIARNKENETMECQAFLCSKRKIAEAVTLTVAESFKLAQERWEEEEKQILEKQQLLTMQMTSNPPTSVTTDHHVEQSRDGNHMGFDDNFADFPMSSSPFAESDGTGFNPFKNFTFTASLSHSDVDRNVIAMSFGNPASRDYGTSGGAPGCSSPTSADELLCL